MKVLVVDNYDSFTYNLVQYLGELGARARGRAQRPRDGRRAARARSPTASSSRPGPCTPERGRHLGRGRCAASPRPGSRRSASAWATSRWPRRSAARSSATCRSTARRRRSSTTAARSSPACASPLTVGRYHSLVVDEDAARLLRGHRPAAAACVMGIRHRELPAEGVQFHPESVLTDDGKQLLRELPGLMPNDILTRGHRRARVGPRPRPGGGRRACWPRSWPATPPRRRSPRFLIALRTKGETVEELAGLARHDARARHAGAVRPRRPARHRRHRRRAPDVQRLDDRRADRRRRRLRGGQARQPLGDRPVGQRRRARGARRAHRPRPRRGRALHRRGRLRLHVRARPPRGDALRRPGAQGARGAHDLQLPRPADQPGRRAAPARRRLRPAPTSSAGGRAGAPGGRPGVGSVQRGWTRRDEHVRRRPTSSRSTATPSSATSSRRRTSGSSAAPRDAVAGGTPRGNAATTRAILAGEPGPRATSPCSTPAPRSTPPACADSLREGVDAAREAIDSGRGAAHHWTPTSSCRGELADAMSVLDRIVDATREDVARRRAGVPLAELERAPPARARTGRSPRR